MLGQNPSQAALYQIVDLEALVPKNHRLRQIDAALDLSFLREALADCYTPGRGRPSVDPEVAMRMMILGVLFNMSDRELCQEVSMHAGYRWFCGLNFHDPVPNHSTLSRLRNERWAGSELFTRLFEEVLQRCISSGMVSGGHVSVDGTLIRANASLGSLERKEDGDDDDQGGVPPQNAEQPGAEAKTPAREPYPKGSWQGSGERYSNKTHYSRTDADARLYRKGYHQSASPSYLVHDMIDTKSRVILGRKASLATGSGERETALLLLDEHQARRERLGLGQGVNVLTGDAGYGSGGFVAELLDRGITAHIPLMANPEPEVVPQYQRRTFNLARYRKRLERVRLIKARNAARQAAAGHGYAVSRKLRVRSEHLFAEGKNEHGLGFARHRGLTKVDRHSLLIATVQNLKRLGHHLHRQVHQAVQPIFARFRLLYNAQEAPLALLYLQWAQCPGPRTSDRKGTWVHLAVLSPHNWHN